jgi:hypothetical protein
LILVCKSTKNPKFRSVLATAHVLQENKNTMKSIQNSRSTILLFAAFFFFACTKKAATPTPPAPEVEENIAFSINPDPGGSVAAASTESYPFKINITSKVSTMGVKIELTTRKDADGVVVDSKSLESTSSVVDVSVGTLSPGLLYNVTVLVTSKKTSSNSSSKLFKLARK